MSREKSINKKHNVDVCILLATYNGEKYIGEMIDSILNQDYENFVIVLSDDASSDSTPEILEGYAQRYSQKVILYHSGMHFGCAQKHFMHLLRQFSDYPHIMFCDQDDIWHKDKISKTMKKMVELEKDNDISVPILVHTDLRVVDSNLNEIAPSFCKYSNLNGNRLAVNQLLVQNVVTGCTVMINNSLAKLGCRSFDEDQMLMHDWWLALLAETCGVAAFLDEPTIDYRQHANNSVGAKNAKSLRYIVNKLKTAQVANSLQDTFKNAQTFLKCYHDIIPQKYIYEINAYANMENKNALIRKFDYIRYGFWKKGLIRKIGQILLG